MFHVRGLYLYSLYFQRLNSKREYMIEKVMSQSCATIFTYSKNDIPMVVC